MPDFALLIVQALEYFALTLERHSRIPWPVTVAAFLPIVAGFLGLIVWYLRGMIWPVKCGYQKTTTGVPCRIGVKGEWHKCHYHGRRWERLSDHHSIDPKLPRWQTYRRGQRIEQTQFYGRGFLKMRSQRVGLFYFRGFARPPREMPKFIIDRWKELMRIYRQVRAVGIRGLWQPWAKPRKVGVSHYLPTVIRASRAALILMVISVIGIAAGIILPEHPRIVSDYLATGFLFSALIVVYDGILLHQSDWIGKAAKEIAVSLLGFFTIAATGGALGLWGYQLGKSSTIVESLIRFSFGTGVVATVLVLWLLLQTKRRRRRRGLI